MQRNIIYNMDCLVGMNLIPDGAIDMILSDLPYGITGCSWDSLLPLPELWRQYWRVLKPNGAVVLTCSQPFTTELIHSCRRHFRYCWYWHKNMVTGFPFAKYQPLRCVEDIAVFYRRMPTYNPQGLIALPEGKQRRRRKDKARVYRNGLDKGYTAAYTNYPRQVLTVECERTGLHPTQKPVALFEYMIRTYTNSGDLVLDSCIGSGTTKVACRNTGRDYIGFETASEFYETALQR